MAMAATADHAEGWANSAAMQGLRLGQAILEVGYRDDIDHELRKGIAAVGLFIGGEYRPQGVNIPDIVLLWFRDQDGDLEYALNDAIYRLERGGEIWLMTPKAGRDGYVEPEEINSAAEVTEPAGLFQAESISAGKDWICTVLI
jgi:Protein of unknown function (DUF3052)